jgi:hypothetical protein
MLKFKPPSFKRTSKYLDSIMKKDLTGIMERLGREGALALSYSTPMDTGEAAASWDYYVERDGDIYRVVWTNSKMAGRTPVVVLVQYGHATGTGGYVPGRDFINPALRPIFTKFSDLIFREVVQ